ncbi:MAG: hypothetical protein CBARDCOR_5519 [uncultured Caballeronia sp.]|nr:MAG: hypothetical protein CBARDCOR_5519 [uncultured Caballeronia sp.]
MLNLGVRLTAASVFPVGLVTVLSAHLFLRIWIGPTFEHKSSLVLQLLAIGLLINSLSKVPSNLIQAHGRSDITAASNDRVAGVHLLHALDAEELGH